MPRHPQVSPAVAAIPGSVYSSLAGRLAALQAAGEEVFPLHVGDTWMEPPEGCRMEDLTVAEYPGMHRYSSPHGLPALVAALAERTTARTGCRTVPSEILLAAGATGALGAVVGAIVAPGEEVLITAPFWPLVSGIVRSFHGVPVHVPFYREADSPEAALEIVARHRTPATVALYVNTPNNPTGRVLERPIVEALAEWARREGLWILADEVYEDYSWGGPHTWTRPLAPERTFSAHSFSKAYGMAGNRCGWVVGPAAAMRDVRKISTHTFYCAPTAAQIAGLRCLQGPGDAWVATARESYRTVGEAAARRLGVAPPGGSTFLFLDVADRLDERGLGGLLEDCAERGLFVAPGPSFGPFPTAIRLCYTAAPPEVVLRGVEALAEVLGR
ncbi:MAG TPA: pyridoxal phosphate-dependent aminotransferase [Thermoanaerobaculia bacterium]|nr:pyridoxal phosphate-dependent aminotransferase [Thermoanaerobaculia bacterium]